MHITGVSGAGKSTLARRVGAVFDLPIHHLDNVACDPVTGRWRTHDERLEIVAAIAAAPRWITDGVQAGWTDDLCERAEVIIWLDHLVGSGALLRIARRFAKQALLEVRLQRGHRRFLRVRDYLDHAGAFVRSIREIRAFDRSTQESWTGEGGSRAATAAQLERFRSKVVHCRTAADVEKLHASIEAAQQSIRQGWQSGTP